MFGLISKWKRIFHCLIYKHYDLYVNNIELFILIQSPIF